MEIQDVQKMMLAILSSGMKEYEIAEKICVSQSTVSRWACGKTKGISIQGYLSIQHLYNIRANTL